MHIYRAFCDISAACKRRENITTGNTKPFCKNACYRGSKQRTACALVIDCSVTHQHQWVSETTCNWMRPHRVCGSGIWVQLWMDSLPRVSQRCHQGFGWAAFLSEFGVLLFCSVFPSKNMRWLAEFRWGCRTEVPCFLAGCHLGSSHLVGVVHISFHVATCFWQAQMQRGSFRPAGESLTPSFRDGAFHKVTCSGSHYPFGVAVFCCLETSQGCEALMGGDYVRDYVKGWLTKGHLRARRLWWERLETDTGSWALGSPRCTNKLQMREADRECLLLAFRQTQAQGKYIYFIPAPLSYFFPPKIICKIFLLKRIQ